MKLQEREVTDNSLDQMLEVWYAKEHLKTLNTFELKGKAQEILEKHMVTDKLAQKLAYKRSMLNEKEFEYLGNFYLMFYMNIFFKE